MTESNKQKLDRFTITAFPFLFLVLFFTNPFAKSVASFASSLCILLFLVRVLVLKKTNYQPKAKMYYIILSVYFGAMAISLIYTPDIGDGLRRFQSQVTKLLMAVIVIEMISSAVETRKYLLATAAGGVVLAAIAIYQGLVRHVYRPPTMWNPVHGGNIFLFALIALISLLFYEKRFRWRVAYIGAGMFMGCAFYLNGTRGAWIALGIVLIVAPLIIGSMNLRKTVMYYFVLLLFAGAVSQMPFFKKKVHEVEIYAQRYEEADSRNAGGKRIEMWKASEKMFLRNPVLGVGLGGWNKTLDQMAARKEVPDYILLYNQTHNIFLDVLSTRGLLGFITFAAVIFYPVFFAWKCREQEYEIYRTLLVFATIAFLVSGMTDTLVYIRGVFISYILFVGLSLAVMVRSRPAGQGGTESTKDSRND
jgi:O-antigen ligase